MRITRTALACAILAANAVLAVPTVASAQPANPVVTLITGDQVTATAPLTNDATGFDEFQSPGGDRYLIPAEATPYLGHGLDRSLFDVTALAKEASRVPVDLSFTGTPSAPPGITLTSVNGTNATGFLTPSAAFATTLRERIGADVAAGRPAGTTPLFPGLTTIRLANTTASATATPHYPLHTVQINATGTVDVFLANVDAFNRFDAQVPISNGIGKVEAPAGHYVLVADFQDLGTDSRPTALHQVVQEGLTVSDTGDTTFSVSESQANLLVTAITPRKATPTGTFDLYARTDATGQQSKFGILGHGAVPVYVNTATPTVGTGDNVAAWFGAAPDNSYAYALAFPTKGGIPANETFTARPDQLATVQDRLHAAPGTTGTGFIGAELVDPAFGPGLFSGTPAAWGGVFTQYFGTADGGTWAIHQTTPAQMPFSSATHTFAPTKTYTIDWDQSPIAPSYFATTGDVFCDACTAGTTLSVAADAVGDGTPDHVGLLFGPETSSDYTLYQGSTKIAENNQGANGVIVTGIPTTRTVYRSVFDLNMTGIDGFSQSTTSHTELTFTYDPNDPPSTTPNGCINWTPATPCRVLPMLGAHYTLAGLNLANTSTAAIQQLTLDITHQSLNNAGSTSPITKVTLAVSFDGTKTWQPIPVIGRNGHYQAFWPNATPGASPALRVTAQDAEGNTLDQTITNAYTIGTRH